MAVAIKMRRGVRAQLPIEAEEGELLLTLDTSELFYGRGVGNEVGKIGGKWHVDVDLSSQANGSTNIFTTPLPYKPNTLRVFKNMGKLRKSKGGATYDVTEVDNMAGTFRIEGYPPISGDVIEVDFEEF